MIPNKLLYYLGYNNLAIVLEQERKHWLMKTDKRKQVQDKYTGDIFEGVLDNRGTDIKITSEKLSITSNVLPTLSFVDTGANSILDFANAAFPFSMGSRGFSFARITSINYPIETTDDLQYKNYRVVFDNVETKTLAFGVSPYSSEVYAGEWIVTSTPPTIQMMDDQGQYTINVNLNIKDSHNAKFYYPLEEGLQPFVINKVGSTKYISESINDDGYIGYPLFWFATDETRTGPYFGLASTGYNTHDMAYMIFSTEGNSGSMYLGKGYVNVDGTDAIGATPDGSLPSNWEIRCSCYAVDSFNNVDSDFSLELDPEQIYFYNKTSGDTTTIPLESGNGENNIITMTRNVGWTYEDNRTYKIDMDTFISNNKAQSGNTTPLIALFDVSLDKTIPYYKNNSSQIGYAGIELTSANPVTDTGERFPHDLDKWEGLPTWYGDPETGIPQHMAVYAIHNTVMYSPLNPESRQVAALLFDPGITKMDDEEFTNDEKGRIYVISNDEPKYENNATAQYPKPARTVARICDIPTSVADFLNVEGLVPVSIVDPKYVRSQAAYTTAEKNKLWNYLNSKVVTPLAMDEYGVPFYIDDTTGREPYPYIFSSIENLRNVDMVTNNDFREWINLNSMVDPTTVSLYSIANPGTGYVQNATGIIIIGGVAMNYVVNEVDAEGKCVDVSVFPQDNETFINLSNFDMQEGNDGITQKYGTTPVASSEGGEEIPRVGEGLEVFLQIANYSEIRMQRGDIYKDLVAFVYEDLELKMYRYKTNSSNPLGVGTWGDPLTITRYERTSPTKRGGGYSSTDSMTRMIVPYMKNINVCSDIEGRELVPIKAMTTPSFINIIDTDHTPIHQYDNTSNNVDLCAFHCEGFSNWIQIVSDPTTSLDILEARVMMTIKEKLAEGGTTLDRDCYLAWQWRNDNHSEFRYGIIRRSMNNYVTTDTTTTIPPTSGMKYDSYIHTNDGTTVVWDVPNIGPMMWVYNQNYNRKEIYNLDPETRDIYISYTNEDDPNNPNIMSWKDIDIRLSPYGGIVEKIVNANNIFNFYIYTNNPVQGDPFPSTLTIQEYNLVKLVSQGDTLTPSTPTPVGNWQLVFPRLNQYKLVAAGVQEGVYNSEVKLRRLIPVAGEDVGTVTNVLDSTGHNINQKIVLFDSTGSGTKMKVYNKETGQFETV